jgi:hypothetical protein
MPPLLPPGSQFNLYDSVEKIVLLKGGRFIYSKIRAAEMDDISTGENEYVK